MQSLAEMITGAGGSYLKWDTPGTTYSGRITEVQSRQARKYDSTDLDFWDDGTAKMQVVLTLATDYRDAGNPDDDGTRLLSINLWSGQKKSLANACKAAGVLQPEVGMKFTASHVAGAGNAKNPRVFEYELTPASVIADALATDDDPAQTAKVLLAGGASVADVAAATGLPSTVVQALANLA
jgi:hypothetical protein